MRRVTINQSGDEFLHMLLHHFGCEGSQYNPLLGMTDDDSCQTNPLEMAGARFMDELVRRFYGEAVA